MIRYPVILFDLFGTIVRFTARVPAVRVGGEVRRSTMAWLEAAVERELPGVRFGDFEAAIGQVTAEIVRGRPPEYLEVHSRLRFQRALALVGCDGASAAETAERLSLAHMAHLASQTEMPAEHRALLVDLGRDRILGLVSNFDHAATARSILAREGIDDLFRVILISDEVGRRKPHPAIFEQALGCLGARRDEALYVGDTIEDDVRGARAAGIDVAWIDAAGAGVPEGAAPPTWTLGRLTDLRAILATTQSLRP